MFSLQDSILYIVTCAKNSSPATALTAWRVYSYLCQWFFSSYSTDMKCKAFTVYSRFQQTNIHGENCKTRLLQYIVTCANDSSAATALTAWRAGRSSVCTGIPSRWCSTAGARCDDSSVPDHYLLSPASEDDVWQDGDTHACKHTSCAHKTLPRSAKCPRTLWPEFAHMHLHVYICCSASLVALVATKWHAFYLLGGAG